jgi:hypothetical protein
MRKTLIISALFLLAPLSAFAATIYPQVTFVGPLLRCNYAGDAASCNTFFTNNYSAGGQMIISGPTVNSGTWNFLPYTSTYPPNTPELQLVSGSFTTETGQIVVLSTPAAPHTITVTQGAHGTISPGTTAVPNGTNQTFTVTPNDGYHTVQVIVDGSDFGPAESYTFLNVTTTHTLTATFALNPAPPVVGASNPAPPVVGASYDQMMAPATSSAMVANVVSAVGQNMAPVSIPLAIGVAVPLLFLVARSIVFLFF